MKIILYKRHGKWNKNDDRYALTNENKTCYDIPHTDVLSI